MVDVGLLERIVPWVVGMGEVKPGRMWLREVASIFLSKLGVVMLGFGMDGGQATGS